MPGQSGFNQVKPAAKKVVEKEKKAPDLPYTQILKMVQVYSHYLESRIDQVMAGTLLARVPIPNLGGKGRMQPLP